MTVGGVDTYYDYDEKQWKSRKLGGGPVRRGPVCPAPRTASQENHGADTATRGGPGRTTKPAARSTA
ncbi:hypothetical protein EV652_12844 [Kribbella steppae]|uniref:Uncharacterized protein n=1 Tax=Kribbella steppae TaxID=2512223 RepID=A0A4R2GRY2_9ACTN|nr:hypothetical protein EV652_12844 [Kribbella steppae]